MKKSLATLLILLATASANACPMCKDSVSNREGEINELHDSYTTNGQNISGGINTSVYLMLGAFFAMLGLTSTVIVKGCRSTNAKRPIDKR